MNRHQRRAEAAQARHWHEPHDVPPGLDRAAAIRWAVAKLAAAPDSATGSTIVFPDGGTVYISVADAKAMHASAGGVAQ